MNKDFVWNLPNALTLFRLATVFICAAVLLPVGQFSSLRFLICLIFFILGAVSDYWDGYFARKLEITSEWGAYMDPLIDKIFIWALYACFIFIPILHTPWWAVAIIILRDIIVTVMRGEAIKKDITFKTSFLAKSKTAIQMIVGVFILCYLWLTYSVVEYYNLGSPERMWTHGIKKIPAYLIMAVALFTLITLVDYSVAFVKNKKRSLA